MSQSLGSVHPPVYRRSSATEITEHRFEGDLFERKELAQRLTDLLLRLPDGAVLSIDSAWGEGKTWFGRRWHKSLQDDGFRTAFIDCFQRDHLDDPFAMLAGELLELAKVDEAPSRRKLLDAGKRIGAALVPAATKLAVSAFGRWALGKANLGATIGQDITDALTDTEAGLETLVVKSLEDYVSSPGWL